MAHRGAWAAAPQSSAAAPQNSAAAPQNSAAALLSAIELGCDMVELDVRRTRDGRLVAIHDARVAGKQVAALDHRELRGRVQPGQAPALEELLELAAGRIRLDVELKEEGYVERVIAALAAHMTADQYVVTSFLPSALAETRRAEPEARTGLLLAAGRRPRVLERRLQEAAADFVAPQASLARAGLLAWAADRGLDCFVWTVNERRALRTLLSDPRVAGVITDRPAKALALRSVAAEADHCE